MEDILRLRAGTDSQATDDKKLRILMRGVRDGIFGGLVRNPQAAVEPFVTEAMNTERALQARASYYQQHSGVVASMLLKALFYSSVERSERSVAQNARLSFAGEP